MLPLVNQMENGVALLWLKIKAQEQEKTQPTK